MQGAKRNAGHAAALLNGGRRPVKRLGTGRQMEKRSCRSAEECSVSVIKCTLPVHRLGL